MQDPTAASPTAKDLADLAAHYLDQHGALIADELVSTVVTIVEAVRYKDGIPVYRRLRITDAMAHPGAVESLVRKTAQDLDAALSPDAQGRRAAADL